jgi:hypothetical protein
VKNLTLILNGLSQDIQNKGVPWQAKSLSENGLAMPGKILILKGSSKALIAIGLDEQLSAPLALGSWLLALSF